MRTATFKQRKTSPGLRSQDQATGFTLIELLVVLAIVGLLAVLAMSAVQPMSESYGITNASLMIRDTLGNAKQLAMSDNQSVEVRFCRSTEAGTALSTYSWLQVCENQPDGTRKVASRPARLPTAICIASNSGLSSVMILPELTPASSDPGLSTIGKQYAYRKVTFLPSGATDLAPASIWFLTTVPQRSTAATILPRNYATIQIDPVNGLTVLYRP